jgi:hypothetical protein
MSEAEKIFTQEHDMQEGLILLLLCKLWDLKNLSSYREKLCIHKQLIHETLYFKSSVPQGQQPYFYQVVTVLY